MTQSIDDVKILGYFGGTLYFLVLFVTWLTSGLLAALLALLSGIPLLMAAVSIGAFYNATHSNVSEKNQNHHPEE